MNRILFAASECVPFFSTGSLAQTCGCLPKEFDSGEWDIRVVIPCYGCIPEEFRSNFKRITSFTMSAGELIHDRYCGILQYELEGITYYFIENEEYFSDSPYGDIRKDIEKFIFFDKAVLSLLRQIDFKPQLIHCHDWETGFIPVYLKNEFQNDPFYHGIRTLMTIHNLKYQGIWDITTMQKLTGFPTELFTRDKLEFHGNASMLKGGLVYADYITTISDTYADQIQTSYFGEGLEGLLSARHFDLQGISGGIDYSEYDPSTDDYLEYRYNEEDRQAKKRQNKLAFQQELGFEENPDRYMIAMITDLTDDKGAQLVEECLSGISDTFTQFVILGKGYPLYENRFRDYAWKYPDRVAALITQNECYARKLFASADAVLIPAYSEPCGTQPMICYRYGTVPIVRETGGLKDTVISINRNESTGTGFTFGPFRADDLLRTVNYSKQVYYDEPEKWNGIVARGFSGDYTWHNTCRRYTELYTFLINK